MSDVTQRLSAIEAGESTREDRFLPLAYEVLRKLAAAKMAQEKPGQPLQATALVHEAWLRLVGSDAQKAGNSRGHIFGAAAEALGIPVRPARRHWTFARAWWHRELGRQTGGGDFVATFRSRLRMSRYA